MGRSTAKGPFVEDVLQRKIAVAQRTQDRKPIKTWSRRSTVTPDFVGMQFLVHNGKAFQSVFVTENMVGHRLGEFAPTRIFRKHGGVKKEVAAPTGTRATTSVAAPTEPAKPAEKK